MFESTTHASLDNATASASGRQLISQLPVVNVCDIK